MSNSVLFVGWGLPVRGREQQAIKVFSEWVEMLGGLQKKGTINGFTPVFLDPHGGDLGGFFVIVGASAKLDELQHGEDFTKAVTRAQLIAENFGVVRGKTGDEITKQMQLFGAQVSEIAK